MTGMIASRGLRLALVASLAGTCGACGSLGSFDPGDAGASLAKMVSFGAPQEPAPASGPASGPIAATEIDCPQVEVQDGTAALRVGGQTNDSVRYQFDVANTARECQIQGSQFGIKIGVAGHLLIGPAGKPGVYSAPLRIVIRRDSDQTPAFSKVYKVEADTAGRGEAPFQLVSEPILLPFTRQQADLDYTVLVGFDSGHVAEAPKGRRKKHPN